MLQRREKLLWDTHLNTCRKEAEVYDPQQVRVNEFQIAGQSSRECHPSEWPALGSGIKTSPTRISLSNREASSCCHPCRTTSHSLSSMHPVPAFETTEGRNLWAHVSSAVNEGAPTWRKACTMVSPSWRCLVLIMANESAQPSEKAAGLVRQ